MIIADTKNADLQIFKSDFNLSKSSHGVKSKLRKKSVIIHFPRLKSKLVYKVIFFLLYNLLLTWLNISFTRLSPWVEVHSHRALCNTDCPI